VERNVSMLYIRVQIRRFHDLLRDKSDTTIEKFTIGKASKCYVILRCTTPIYRISRQPMLYTNVY
jgi:hypothetical protein